MYHDADTGRAYVSSTQVMQYLLKDGKELQPQYLQWSMGDNGAKIPDRVLSYMNDNHKINQSEVTPLYSILLFVQDYIRKNRIQPANPIQDLYRLDADIYNHAQYLQRICYRESTEFKEKQQECYRELHGLEKGVLERAIKRKRAEIQQVLTSAKKASGPSEGK